MAELVGHKRKAIDETFRRMFDYDWGTSFGIDEGRANLSQKALIQMLGRARASRILGTTAKFTTTTTTTVAKKRKVDSDLHLDHVQDLGGDATFSSSLSANQVQGLDSSRVAVEPNIPQHNTTTVVDKDLPGPSVISQPTATTTSKIDDVLKRLAGPSKTSTVQKTNNDWESFKETDKLLQEELEKQAQGKDAFLVKQDFLVRVDNRKFQIEKEARDKERAKRMPQG